MQSLKAAAAAAVLTQDVHHKVHGPPRMHTLTPLPPHLLKNPGPALVTFAPPHVHDMQSLKATAAAAALTQDVH